MRTFSFLEISVYVWEMELAWFLCDTSSHTHQAFSELLISALGGHLW